ncbi:MAG: putative sulfate exporter family transporter [Candidatus Electrothrix aestuarii]|uniref:Sulfate exporter family transporter n=1 Tax=Candidatus Electrothrix aestuarii TaxID=3062594 RepID=A0AAU8LZ79_9BACT
MTNSRQNTLANKNNKITTPKKTGKILSSWNTADYWSILLAFALIIPCLFFYATNEFEQVTEQISWKKSVMQNDPMHGPFKSVAWYKAFDEQREIQAADGKFGTFLKEWLAKPHKWTNNPLNAFFLTKAEAYPQHDVKRKKYEEASNYTAMMKALALSAQNKAENDHFKNLAANKDAQEKISQWRRARLKQQDAKKQFEKITYNIVPGLLGIMLFSGVVFALPVYCIRRTSPVQFFIGFVPVFLLSVLSYTLAAQTSLRHYGLGYSVWGIILGMLIANTIGTPRWIRSGLQIELYTKTALILLGAEIILTKVMAIGAPGFLIAWVGAPIVLLTSFWFGKKILKIESDTLNMVISADLSICGTSAAIATAAACRAKEEELTFAIGLSLVFTAVMMVLMPICINAIHMNEVLAGAWLGGSIDATGAVASAGSLVSNRALEVAVTIKMIQNILIGIVAFCVAVYWSVRAEATNKKITLAKTWRNFPKFILGFIGAMFLFSFVYSRLDTPTAHSLLDQGVIRNGTKLFRDWFFCFSFVAIGLQCNFRKLKKYFEGGKTLSLYLFGQSLQLVLSFLLAYLGFFVFFPDSLSQL